MSDYTPTTEQVRDTWTFALLEGMASAEEVNDCNWELPRRAAQFDRWLAEVERASAEKAVRGFVSRVSDSIEDYLSIATLDALGAEYIRAAAYRREETE